MKVKNIWVISLVLIILSFNFVFATTPELPADVKSNYIILSTGIDEYTLITWETGTLVADESMSGNQLFVIDDDGVRLDFYYENSVNQSFYGLQTTHKFTSTIVETDYFNEHYVASNISNLEVYEVNYNYTSEKCNYVLDGDGEKVVFFSPPNPVKVILPGIQGQVTMILPVGLGILGLVLSYKILPRLLYKFL